MSQNMNMSVGVVAIARWSLECICLPFVQGASFNLRRNFRIAYSFGWTVDTLPTSFEDLSVYLEYK